MPQYPAEQVIAAALVVPYAHQDIEGRAALIAEALREHGHLPSLTPTPAEQQALLEAAAVRLVQAARHRRFDSPDGWRQLLPADADAMVVMAHRHALQNSPQSQHDGLTSDYNLLLNAHQAERAQAREARS